ncbi:MAG TPA: hypothetical protein VG734_04435 [Lacunisphaera sp.]|nr:hypothetical protein [Lacunisphaera sp.]
MSPRTFGWSALAGIWPAMLLPVVAMAQAGPDVTAIAGRVFNGYTRSTEADGKVRPETYAVGNGGRYDSTASGDSVDTMPFRQLAGTLAPALAAAGYRPARDPDKTDLMIMVYWGTTLSSRGETGRPVFDRDVVEKFNIRMLGFEEAVSQANALYFTTMGTDMLKEFEASRYFVVLRAYDFPLAHKEKKLKLLWETRISVRREGNDFVATLPLMARDASKYFGQATHGLAWPAVNEGRVRLGETKFLNDKPEDKPAPEAEPAK